MDAYEQAQADKDILAKLKSEQEQVISAFHQIAHDLGAAGPRIHIDDLTDAVANHLRRSDFDVIRGILRERLIRGRGKYVSL